MCKQNGWLAAIVAMMALVGCESVNSRHILGERISDDLSEDLDGPWNVNGDVVVFHQVAPGEFRVGGLEWDDEAQKFKTIELQIFLTRLGDHSFFNLVRFDDPETQDDDVEGTWHQFILYELDEAALSIRSASSEAFAKAVEQGKLAGRVDIKREADGKVKERHVWIEGDKADLDAFVKDGDIDALFGETQNLKRITDDDES